MMRLRIVSLLIMSCSLHINAQIGKKFEASTEEGNKLTYEIKSDNTVILLRNEKTYAYLTKITIPKSVVYKGNSYQVTEIEPGCFRFVEKLEVVSIPETNKELRSVEIAEWKNAKSMSGDLNHMDYWYYGTFYGCKKLREIILPNSISTIEQLTFAGCESLYSISLPSGLLTIGGGCFAGCSSLRKIILPQNITKIEDALYHHTKYGSSTMAWYDKLYYKGFFEGCIALTEVEIPINVIKIDGKTFYGCKSLKSIKGFNAGIQVHETYEKYGYQNGSTYNLFDNSGIRLDSLKATFSFYAEDKIRNSLKEWQKKKEFETTDQYQLRVT